MKIISTIGTQSNPFEPESQRWHVFIDFSCMPSNEFTLDEVFKYHGLDKVCDIQHRFSLAYYTPEILTEFLMRGFIELDLGAETVLVSGRECTIDAVEVYDDELDFLCCPVAPKVDENGFILSEVLGERHNMIKLPCWVRLKNINLETTHD